jgi:sulfite exporter TauE/SafE
MNTILLAFITGLTTGGLSCLAVQGGLLASSLAQQIEKDVLGQSIAGPQKAKQSNQRASGKQLLLPIALFLGAKLIAYTLLGSLLGWVGSLFMLTPVMRAVLLLAIGIFMVGNASRMFDVHPIFRHFVIEPPASIRRFIRRTAKNETEFFTPLFLGALTVLIPCGVTQAMMAVAMGTGSSLQGAAIMFAFTLGTSPVFFTVAYLATRLGARMEKAFLRFVAVVVLVVGLISVDSGLNLIGSPVSVSRWVRSAFSPQVTEEPAPTQVADLLTLTADNDGYWPQVLYAKAGEPVILNVITQNTQSCARAFVIPSLGVNELLPITGTVPIVIPPQENGTSMVFTCSMGMYSGKILFTQ